MTSATTTPASGARRRHAEAPGHGLVLFAAALLLIIGCAYGSRQNPAAA